MFQPSSSDSAGISCWSTSDRPKRVLLIFVLGWFRKLIKNIILTSTVHVLIRSSYEKEPLRERGLASWFRSHPDRNKDIGMNLVVWEFRRNGQVCINDRIQAPVYHFNSPHWCSAFSQVQSFKWSSSDLWRRVHIFKRNCFQRTLIHEITVPHGKKNSIVSILKAIWIW